MVYQSHDEDELELPESQEELELYESQEDGL